MIIDKMDHRLDEMEDDENDLYLRFELNTVLEFKTEDDISKAHDIFNALLAYAEATLNEMKNNKKGKRSNEKDK